MGVDAGDFDNDGDEDLFITELTGQGSDLYVNDGSGIFEDQSARSGLRLSSLPYTGFGAAWLDVDNDGWLDILTVNGAVHQHRGARAARNDPFPLHQRKQLFRNLGGGQFEDVTARAGAVFQMPAVGRGAAFGDVDNDGDIDVRRSATTTGRAELLINQDRAIARTGSGSEPVGGQGQGPRHGRRARRQSVRADGVDAVAAGASGRQLRVGQRSARAGRPWDVRETGSRAGHLAGRQDGRMERRAGRSVHDAEEGSGTAK